MLSDEKDVIEMMEDYLDSKGFTEKIFRTDKFHGVDIQRRNPALCRYWFIEAKGEPSKYYEKGPKKGKAKSQQTISSQRYSWFTTAIGQISTRMYQENGRYGIAFPKTDYYEKKSLELRLFRQRSKINFFLLDENRNVFQLTPGARGYKKV